MQKVNQKQPLQTISGKFHVGMTAKQAKEKDLYKSVFSRDFTDIDTDGNGILSGKEICAERDRECKSRKISSGLGMVAGTLQTGLGVATSEVGIGISLMAIGSTVAITEAKNYKDANAEQRKTEQYKKQHPREFGL